MRYHISCIFQIFGYPLANHTPVQFTTKNGGTSTWKTKFGRRKWLFLSNINTSLKIVEYTLDDTALTGAPRNSHIHQATSDNNPAQVLSTLVRPFVIYTSCLLRSEVFFKAGTDTSCSKYKFGSKFRLTRPALFMSNENLHRLFSVFI